MRRTIVLISLCSALLAPAVYGQKLPAEWRITPDGRMLILGDQDKKATLYDHLIVRDIHLSFTQPNYWQIMQGNYQSQTNLMATMVVDGITYDSVGVRFKGQTSYSQTGNAQKKSFNIETDWLVPGQKLMGYDILNLHNCFQDESFMREVFFQHQLRNHIPIAKSAFTKLYINGQNWGVYPNIEQVSGEFLNEWFLSNDGSLWRADRPPGSPGGPGGGWGDGTAALNYHGPDTSLYQPYYTLKRFTKTNPWDDLVNTCDVLNNTPLANLPQTLAGVMDIDRTLWVLAAEILFSDDDSYVHKGKMDYYVYYEPETGRMVAQEYDGNSVMSPNYQYWSPFYHETNPNYPLLNRLLAIPGLRQRYLAHLRTLIAEAFDTTTAFPLIDGYKALIDTMVQNDPKKLYSYSQFVNEITVLKNFITLRKGFLNNNPEVMQTGPSISNTVYYTNGNAWTAPSDSDDVVVNASLAHTSGIQDARLYYSNGLVGNFTRTDMFDDGQHDDGAAGDGVYGATIPGHAAGSWVRFYVEGAAANNAQTVTYDPPGAEHDVYIYVVAPKLANDTHVVINELMASNISAVTDNAGEYDDWIELYNNSTSPVDISGYFLTDNTVNLTKYTFPQGTVLLPNAYLIVWADEDASQGAFHANFKLSAAGEQLYLLNPGQELVDSISWGQQVADMGFARVPNGVGNFIIQQHTYAANNNLTSVQELEPAVTDLLLFPNPAREVLNIKAVGTERAELTVTDMPGRLVYRSELHGEARISLAGWKAGIYLVRCGALTRKLVVQ